MKNFEEIVKDVERDLVINMAISLKYKRMKMGDAKKLASEFIGSTFQNEEDLFQRLLGLSRDYTEVRKVFIKYAPAFYKEKDRLALEEVRAKYGN